MNSPCIQRHLYCGSHSRLSIYLWFHFCCVSLWCWGVAYHLSLLCISLVADCGRCGRTFVGYGPAARHVRSRFSGLVSKVLISFWCAFSEGSWLFSILFEEASLAPANAAPITFKLAWFWVSFLSTCMGSNGAALNAVPLAQVWFLLSLEQFSWFVISWGFWLSSGIIQSILFYQLMGLLV